MDGEADVELFHQSVEDRERFGVRVTDDDGHADVAGVLERGARSSPRRSPS
jgi:dTDP-glucose pyrophosphorylase